MAGQLISIALTVDQHDGGDYFWVLLESFDNSMEFEPLMEAAKGFLTYAEALQAGYAVLRGLSEDLNVGPRDDIDGVDGTHGVDATGESEDSAVRELG
jgi:hypothetical protein